MMTIRAAEANDMDALVSLLAELFQIEEDFQINPAKQRAGLKLLLNSIHAKIIVAENAKNQIVAMCSLQIVISTAEGAKVGLVEDVIVSAAYRGQGIGKKLLEFLQEWAMQHDLKRLQLLADKNNQPALGFYAQQNWQTTQLIGLRKLL
jgi:ribosomal protein S18 acetylase RimI-like enzyme